jgi:hypothetical protein
LRKNRLCIKELVEFCLSFPLWLDLPKRRVVHACRHLEFMSLIGGQLDDNCCLNESFLKLANEKGAVQYDAIEAIPQGIEVELPEGHSSLDNNGIERRHVRIRWGDKQAATCRQAAILDVQRRMNLPDIQLPDGKTIGYDGEKPVFMGHYWLTGHRSSNQPKSLAWITVPAKAVPW